MAENSRPPQPPPFGMNIHQATFFLSFKTLRIWEWGWVHEHFKIYYQEVPTDFAFMHRKQSIFPSPCLKVQFGGTDVDYSILGSSTGGNFKILPSSSTERIHESAASEKGGQRPPWSLRIGQQLLPGFSGRPTASMGTEHQPSISQWWPSWPMHWGSPRWFRKRVMHQSNSPNWQKNKTFFFLIFGRILQHLGT